MSPVQETLLGMKEEETELLQRQEAERTALAEKRRQFIRSTPLLCSHCKTANPLSEWGFVQVTYFSPAFIDHHGGDWLPGPLVRNLLRCPFCRVCELILDREDREDIILLLPTCSQSSSQYFGSYWGKRDDEDSIWPQP